MAISDSDKYLLNNLAGLYPTVKLGDLIEAAEEGGLSAGAVGTTELAALGVTTAKLAADAVDGTKLADDAVSLEHLDAGITPTHLIVGAGEFTTVGGDANESITVAGALGTDTALVWIRKAGAVARTVDTITPGVGAVAVVMSGDPSNDHVLTYLVLRAPA